MLTYGSSKVARHAHTCSTNSVCVPGVGLAKEVTHGLTLPLGVCFLWWQLTRTVLHCSIDWWPPLSLTGALTSVRYSLGSKRRGRSRVCVYCRGCWKPLLHSLFYFLLLFPIVEFTMQSTQLCLNIHPIHTTNTHHPPTHLTHPHTTHTPVQQCPSQICIADSWVHHEERYLGRGQSALRQGGHSS